METEATSPREARRVLLFADLTGYTRVASRLGALDLARALDRLYRAWEETIGAHSGRIVKFMGDGCLAVFGETAGPQAVACAEALTARLPALRLPWDARVNVCIHAAVVAEGEFGAAGRFDVVGSGVNYLFVMSKGAGIRISEPVFRQLPNDRRGSWEKDKPPVTYVLERAQVRP
jgi:class 3 adenylate cyclase